MACFYPKQALKTSVLTRNGKNAVRFISNQDSELYRDSPNLLSGLPCGQCIGCRLERSRQWAIRCMNEAQLHEENCFVTCTFDDEHLYARHNPISLDKPEFQKFLKRLRKRFPDKKIRYYMCGEYGERYKRPHYHAILFGIDFPDKKLEKIENGFRYYSSSILRELWPFGNNIISDVSFDTCAYVARYIMKKHLGKDAWMQYFEYIDWNTGECVGHRIPEYTTMSRRSGIGKEFLDRYLQDIYPHDRIFMRGRGYSKPPKYYDTQFEIHSPTEFERLKAARIDAAKSKASDNTTDRLIAKQTVKLAQLRTIKRNRDME